MSFFRWGTQTRECTCTGDDVGRFPWCCRVWRFHLVVFTRKQNAREWKKSDVGISHQTENEKENLVYVQKEAAPPTAAAAAAAAVEKQKDKMPKGISHQTEKEKENFVYVQKEAAPTAAAAAAAAAAVEKQKEKKKPKLEKHGHINTHTILEFPDNLIGKRAPPRELQLQQDHHVCLLYTSPSPRD